MGAPRLSSQDPSRPGAGITTYDQTGQGSDGQIAVIVDSLDDSQPIKVSTDDSFDPELDCAVQELLSFDGAESLLRAAPLDVLLTGGGRIFSSSVGTEATYSLSCETDRIGYFVSHNWAVQRAVKFLALAFKFNMVEALIAAAAVWILCFALALFGLQPTFTSVDSDYKTAVAGRLLLVPVVVVVVCFGRFFHRAGSGPSIFLDKVCIHQADTGLQQAGIRKLGAFLRVSDRMLVLYSSVYLKRLWTVYEVASFLTLHSVEKLELVPVVLPVAFFLVLGGHLFFQYLSLGVQFFGLPAWMLYASNIGGASVYYVAQRLWAKSKADIKHTLQNFSVHNAECAVESDRQIVQRNIVALMKGSKRVSRQAPAHEALETFDRDVREHVSAQFGRIFGNFSFSYMEYLIFSLTGFAPTYVDTWSRLADGQTLREAVGSHALDLFWVFSGFTIWQLVTEIVAAKFTHLRGCLDVLWGVVGNGTVIVFGLAMLQVTGEIDERAKTDDVLLVCLLVLQVVTTAISLWFFPKVCSQHRRSGSRTTASASITKRMSSDHIVSAQTEGSTVPPEPETSIPTKASSTNSREPYNYNGTEEAKDKGFCSKFFNGDNDDDRDEMLQLDLTINALGAEVASV